MTIQTAWICERGGREYNDDTAALFRQPGVYAYVGDGLGGYAGGKLASQAAGKALMERAREGGLCSREQILLAAAEADQAVRDLQQQTQGNMKTTLVFLALEENCACWTHVGDSRLYRFRGGSLQFQTRDHSVSQLAALSGEIDPSQIRFHPDRNKILRALGASSSRPEACGPEPLQPGDVFLLCTDGFWEYVLEEEMEALLKTAFSPERWLIAMEALLHKRAPANHDNYTALAVFC